MGKKLNYKYVAEYISSFGYKLLSDEYENIHKKIKIECDKGHIFEMSFNNFKKGQRCKKCNKQNKYTYEYIKEIAEKNGYKLLNNKNIDLNMRSFLKLKDSDNKIIEMMLYSFENKFIKNNNKKKVNKNYNNKKYSQEYVEQLIKDRGYQLLNEYKNNKSKLKIKCKRGHIHEIRFDSFVKGSGCKQCMKENMSNNIEDVKIKLSNRGYKLLSKYDRNNKPITLQCDKGHIFSSTYDIIVNNESNCPICNESKGERNIELFLNNYNIKHIRQYKFKECKFFRELPFDFYLPEHNICIEFDGIQHFKIIKHFGGIDSFINRKIRDTIKNIYCENNEIKLLRISYLEINNIEKILKKELNIA